MLHASPLQNAQASRYTPRVSLTLFKIRRRRKHNKLSIILLVFSSLLTGFVDTESRKLNRFSGKEPHLPRKVDFISDPVKFFF